MSDINRFVGNFEIRGPSGNPKVYQKGDVVDLDGTHYLATRRTSGYSPLHGERVGWEKMSSIKTMNFTNSETEPEIANEGDHWFNSSSGKLFIYIEDKDTKQWIEL
tara:strand:- start:2772 stop:3089 length:318 start_codon:yes stop_codon:yes gene_type:complete